MRKTGGAILVIAGIFSIGPAVAAIILGSLDSLYESLRIEWLLYDDAAEQLMEEEVGAAKLGSLQAVWLAIIVSFLIIVVGLISIISRYSISTGLLALGFSIIGILFGSSLVMVAMGIASIGSVLVVVDGIVGQRNSRRLPS